MCACARNTITLGVINVLQPGDNSISIMYDMYVPEIPKGLISSSLPSGCVLIINSCENSDMSACLSVCLCIYLCPTVRSLFWYESSIIDLGS